MEYSTNKGNIMLSNETFNKCCEIWKQQIRQHQENLRLQEIAEQQAEWEASPEGQKHVEEVAFRERRSPLRRNRAF
jgi:hypothetical protein